METQVNELVVRLSKEQNIEASRPSKTAESLKECINRKYVHIMFKETGTELGVQLFIPQCKLDADYDNANGTVHIVGGLTLNYVKVKCVADINLATCEGTGYLLPVSNEEYAGLMKN